MGDRSRRARLCAGASIFVIASMFGAAGVAKAQSVSPDELRTLKAQIDALQAKVKDLESKQQQSDANAQAAKRQASEAQAQAAAAKASASQASATAAKTQTQVANLPSERYRQRRVVLPAQAGRPADLRNAGRRNHRLRQYRRVVRRRLKDCHRLTSAVRPTSTAVTAAASVLPPAILAGCRTSRPICPIWAFGASKTTCPEYPIGGLSISSKPDLTFPRFRATDKSNSNLSNQVNGALFSRNSYIGLANPAYRRHQDRQRGHPIQDLNGGIQSVFRHVGRLLGRHGQYRRR